MNAYDFDNTIYDGESIVDFFFFILKKDIKLIRFVPIILFYLLRYKFNIVTVEKIAEVIEKFSFSFFKNSKLNYEKLAKEFWDKNSSKLKKEFVEKLKEDDLIITGCPDFLIEHVRNKLKVKNIICSKFDFETKKLTFLCLGENKVIAYKERFKNKKINEFYTDSYLDTPFMEISKKVFLVNKNKIKQINKDKSIKK